MFVEHPNRVLSRDDLIERLKGYERGAFDRSIDVRVTRLRRKIEADPAHPAYIRTVRGEGYLFNPQRRVDLMAAPRPAARGWRSSTRAGWRRCSSRSNWSPRRGAGLRLAADGASAPPTTWPA